MTFCIAGKNNIAVDVCRHLIEEYPWINLVVIPTRNDFGIDTFQHSLKLFAQHESISMVELNDIYDIEDLVFLSLEFDRIIRPSLFKSDRLYNIHFSLLPKYKGMYTSAWPILNGETESGVTLHRIDSGIDTGEIIAQRSFALSQSETCKSLYYKFIQTGTSLMIDYLDSIVRNEIQSFPQSSSGSTYYSKASIDYSHLSIDLNQTADMIDRCVRAYDFRFYQKPIINDCPILCSKITDIRSYAKPGTVLEDNKDFFEIATIDFNLVLFKDRFEEIVNQIKNGAIDDVVSILKISNYREEQDNVNGWNLLMYAVAWNRVEIVQHLLNNGFRSDFCDYSGISVFDKAIEVSKSSGDNRLVDLLG